MFPSSKRLRQLLAMAGMAAASIHAWADPSPAHGSVVYARCAACHGSSTSPTIPQVLLGRNAPSVIRSAINTISFMRDGLGAISDADVADVAAFLGDSPSSASFPDTTVGQSSASRSVTVTASAILALGGMSASASGDFQVTGGTCGTSLAAGSTCTVAVQFAPTAAGARTGTLTLVNNAFTAGIQIPLSGTALSASAPSLAVSTANLAFGDQVQGTTSAAQTLSLQNTGNAPLNFSSIAVGGDLAADFRIGAGTCQVGTAVPAGNQCTVSVSFSPSAIGARSATLQVASDGGQAQVQLAGRGVSQPAPSASFSVAQLAFGNQTIGTTSAAQTVTLTNGGSAVLNITAIQAPAPFRIAQNACGSTLAAQASCQVQVTFSPTAAGAAAGNLTLTSDSTTHPTVALTGTGAVAVPQLTWTPLPPSSTLNFGAGTVGSEQPLQMLTLHNQGPNAVTITELRLGGTDASDFLVDGTTTCQVAVPLPAGSSCTILIGYVPHAVGQRSGSLTVVSNGSEPGTITLAGSAMAAPAPAIKVSAQSLTFDRPATGTVSKQNLTITNSGTAALDVSSIVSSSASFTVAGAGANPCATPSTLAPGASCEVAVSWNGASDQASLTITGNAPQSPVSISLAAAAPAGGGTGGGAQNYGGGGGCTMGNGTGLRDPSLIVMALLAGFIYWRRSRRNQPKRTA